MANRIYIVTVAFMRLYMHLASNDLNIPAKDGVTIIYLVRNVTSRLNFCVFLVEKILILMRKGSDWKCSEDNKALETNKEETVTKTGAILNNKIKTQGQTVSLSQTFQHRILKEHFSMGLFLTQVISTHQFKFLKKFLKRNRRSWNRAAS